MTQETRWTDWDAVAFAQADDEEDLSEEEETGKVEGENITHHDKRFTQYTKTVF